MAGLHEAALETQKYIKDEHTSPKPNNIIFYANNTAVIQKIFKGTQGKAQDHSCSFRRVISKILEEFPNTRIAISWCLVIVVS